MKAPLQPTKCMRNLNLVELFLKVNLNCAYINVTINWVTLMDSDVQNDKVSVDNKNVSLTWDFFFRRQFIHGGEIFGAQTVWAERKMRGKIYK